MRLCCTAERDESLFHSCWGSGGALGTRRMMRSGLSRMRASVESSTKGRFC